MWNKTLELFQNHFEIIYFKCNHSIIQNPPSQTITTLCSRLQVAYTDHSCSERSNHISDTTGQRCNSHCLTPKTQTQHPKLWTVSVQLMVFYAITSMTLIENATFVSLSHVYKCTVLSNDGARNFHLGAIAPKVQETSGGPEVKPDRGSGGSWSSLQTLFLQFWLQKRSKFQKKISAQFTPWLLTSLFHSGVPV